MRWIKRRQNQKQTLVFQSFDAVVANARYDTVSQSKMPVIQIVYKMKNPRTDGITGEIIDSVEIEMDLWEANKHASDLMAAIDSAMPRRGRGAQRVPWE